MGEKKSFRGTIVLRGTEIMNSLVFCGITSFYQRL